jgi:hypothetical protein
MIDPPPELRVVRTHADAAPEVAEPTVVEVVAVDVGGAVVTDVVSGPEVEAEVGGEATTAVKGRWLTSESAVETAQKATAVVAEVANNQAKTSPHRFMAIMLVETRLFRIRGG